MFIESIQITSFAALKGVHLDLSSGLNLLEGNNESGKSTVAECIRFVLYGFQGKTDRERYLGFSATSSEASLLLRDGEKRYRVERKCTGAKEQCGVYDLDNGNRVYEDKVPGEVFFGLPASLFVSTVFVGQTGGNRIDGKGTAEAVDNLLFSADEGVNIKKAMKRLDDMRVTLLHKNKKGGSLYELEGEIAALQVRLQETAEQHREILALESSIADIDKKLTHERKCLAAEQQYLEDYRVLELRRRKRRLLEKEKAFHEAAKSYTLHKETYTRNGFFPDASYFERIKECGAELGRYDEILRELDEKLKKHNETVAIHQKKREELSLEGEREKKRLSGKRGLSLMTAVLTCFAFLCGVVFSALTFMTGNTTLGAVLAVFTGLSFGGMIFAFAMISRYTNGMRALEQAPTLRDDMLKDISDELAQEMAQAHKNRHYYKDKLDDLCAKWNFTANSKNLTELKTVIDEEKRLADEQERARITYLNLKTQEDEDAFSVEDDGRELIFPENYDPKASARRMSVLSDSVRAKRERKHNDEMRLATLTAVAGSPVPLLERLAEKEETKRRLQARYDACTLAEETLAAAGEAMRASLSPRLSKLAGQSMAAVTESKYSELGVDGTMSMTFRAPTAEGGRITKEEEFMSAGTADVAYVSLRLALASVLCGDNLPPMLFDESFSRLDDKRLARMLSLLSLHQGQVVLMSSCDREARLSEAMQLPIHRVSLND